MGPNSTAAISFNVYTSLTAPGLLSVTFLALGADPSLRVSPPFSAQQADLIRHQALLQEGHVCAADATQAQVPGGRQLHEAVDKGQCEAQVAQCVCVCLLQEQDEMSRWASFSSQQLHHGKSS